MRARAEPAPTRVRRHHRLRRVQGQADRARTTWSSCSATSSSRTPSASARTRSRRPGELLRRRRRARRRWPRGSTPSCRGTPACGHAGRRSSRRCSTAASFRSCRSAARSARAAISARSRTSSPRCSARGASTSLRARRHLATTAAELPRRSSFGFSDAEEIKPTYKEGLALVNGVNFSAAMLALGVHDAERLADVADAAAALTLEAICGCTRALDPKVHEARGHPGQIASAARMREPARGQPARRARRRGAGSRTRSAARRRSTAPRATPSRYARHVAEREINAATDNPLFFPGRARAVRPAVPRQLAGRRIAATSASPTPPATSTASRSRWPPTSSPSPSPSWRTSPSGARRCCSTATTTAACRRTSPRGPA